MTLRLHNTLTRQKEEFRPIDPKNVRMYVCGPTVYDFAHIGNARPAIVFDVLFRLLRHRYGENHVTYVRNITDIDDKINARAKEMRVGRNVPVLDVVRELTEVTARVYFEDVAALGNLLPTHTPRATEFVTRTDGKTDMVGLIETLIASGHAYESQGHVLFDVSSKADYGKLARRTLDEMIAGARVDIAPYKKNPMDFVLWKPSDDETPGWDSHWGRGRPGWHIECSAMSDAFLGDTFDIHGGGIDLMFPHHENELAQSESAHPGKPFANVWMHNGFLQVEGEKMSKSLGNFVTIRDLLSSQLFGGRSWPGQVLRFNMLKTHYRQPIDWTLDSLASSFEELQSWAIMLSTWNAGDYAVVRRGSVLEPKPSQDIIDALSDDLNTPNVLTLLRGYFQGLLKRDAIAARNLMEACEFLGILRADRLFAYNPYHVGDGPRLLPQHLKPDMSEIQTAYLNSNQGRISHFLTKFAREGVTVEVRDGGSLEYRVSDHVITLDVQQIQQLIDLRNAAKKKRDFAEADRIRQQLDESGITLKDTSSGTTWEVKR